MFTKILIANRGEIAIRLMRACRELGIRTVAVYSEADRDALHVRTADESVLLGDAAPRDSYLNIDKILAAARQTGARAIHPGYGFLSENPNFAQAVESAGLTFIGPSAAAIRLMGDKAESKSIMKQAGVPTVPGFEELETESDFKRLAAQIGYPVLIKAAAGGGGRGMRIVNDENGIREALESARREALNAFGDDRLLLEKFIPDAHHVEFQVLGDRHGHLLHLFERECSVQRRHQKIIEETPSPLVTPNLRVRMAQAAVDAARAAGYYNAGTVEFIVDPSSLDFYFLEMNTRLQVEHPVTELVTGLDLPQWQIRIAGGETLPFTQSDLGQRGHAIECRIYAEDPAHGFLPGAGRLIRYIPPQGPGIRLDSGFETGSEVTHYYDPLLAKLIVYAEDRSLAIRRMQAALHDFVIHGVPTNIDFLQAVLAHPDFARGAVTTRWVETVLNWQPSAPPAEAALAAALNDLNPSTAPFGIPSSAPSGGAPQRTRPDLDPYSPWKHLGNFRN